MRLLQAVPGVDVNAVNQYGWTPLLMAIDSGRFEVAVEDVDVNASSNARALLPSPCLVPELKSDKLFLLVGVIYGNIVVLLLERVMNSNT